MGLRALESLDACGNQLKRGGACALAKACARKPGLALLALDENEISEAGLEALRVGGLGRGLAGCPAAVASLSRPAALCCRLLQVYPRHEHAALLHAASLLARLLCLLCLPCLLCLLCLVQEIMKKIGKPEALGSLEDNMADEEEEEEEEAEDDGIEIDDVAGDDLAAAMGAAHI